MKQAIYMLILAIAALLAGEAAFGYGATYKTVYGALAIMALMIAGTFLWLYLKRATPLALGMAFSWAGCAGVLSWFWLYRTLERPMFMQDNDALFVLLAFYFVGATLHFVTIQRTLGWHGQTFLLPVIGSFIVAMTVNLIF
ncbi:MAG: hypothetical protein AAFN59_09720 [Pseudomonadota bacterium]